MWLILGKGQRRKLPFFQDTSVMYGYRTCPFQDMTAEIPDETSEKMKLE